MKKWKKFGVFLGVILLSLLTACGTPSGNDATSQNEDSQETYKIRVSHNVQSGQFMDNIFTTFKDEIESSSNGKIQVEIYPSGQLAPGDEDARDGVSSGLFEFTRIPTLVMAQLVNEFGVLDLPYAIQNRDELYAFLDSSIGQEIVQNYEQQTGVKVIGAYDLGYFFIANSVKPINEPSDLKGLKIRTTQNPIHIETIKALGGSATPMPFGEVFTSLQQGVVDGLVMSMHAFEAQKFYEAAPYVTLTNHNVIPDMLVMNKAYLDKLPEDLQTKVVEAAEKALEFARTETVANYDNTISRLKEKGVNFVELTPDSLEKFKEATQPVIEGNIDGLGRDFYNNFESELQNIRNK